MNTMNGRCDSPGSDSDGGFATSSHLPRSSQTIFDTSMRSSMIQSSSAFAFQSGMTPNYSRSFLQHISSPNLDSFSGQNLHGGQVLNESRLASRGQESSSGQMLQWKGSLVPDTTARLDQVAHVDSHVMRGGGQVAPKRDSGHMVQSDSHVTSDDSDSTDGSSSMSSASSEGSVHQAVSFSNPPSIKQPCRAIQHHHQPYLSRISQFQSSPFQSPSGQFQPSLFQSPSRQFQPSTFQSPSSQFQPSPFQSQSCQFQPSSIQSPSGQFQPSTFQSLSGQFQPSLFQSPSRQFQPSTFQSPSSQFQPSPFQSQSCQFQPSSIQSPSGQFQPSLFQSPSRQFQPSTFQSPSSQFQPSSFQSQSCQFQPSSIQSPSGQIQPSSFQSPSRKFQPSPFQSPSFQFQPSPFQSPSPQFQPSPFQCSSRQQFHQSTYHHMTNVNPKPKDGDFTKQQKLFLANEYLKENKYLTPASRKRIAEAVGLSEMQVANWFKRQRRNERKAASTRYTAFN